jgi:hypothetical protein
MSKLLNKVIPRQPAPPAEAGGRITNETVAEHRERILSDARKFKYPLQYTKHRILLTSIGIVIIASISFLGFAGWQLYVVQNTDKFIYRLTQAIPVPVASADGDWVSYSDYLRELRSSVHYFSTKEAVNFNSDDGKRQLEYQKRLALDKAIEGAVVTKLAKQENISITGQELNDFIDAQIGNNKLGLSRDAYAQVISDYYDWSLDEYGQSVKKQLLRQKVSAKLDTIARKKAEDALKLLQSGTDFAKLAGDISEDAPTKGSGGDAGPVSKNATDPSGLIATANSLQPGQISSLIEGVDGFYIIKLLETNQDEVRFAKILVKYNYLDQKIAELKDQGKISEYIKVSPIATPAS